jgi:branched-chain amino acid aminotransferase
VPRIVAKVEADRRRAWPGGTGDVKVPSNYAATVVAERQARGDGAHLVLWLDPADRRVEEFSSSSALLVDGEGRLIAPPPSSTVLDGVTRRSVVELATEAGTEVRQDPFVWPDPSAADAGPDGTMLAAGTAAGLVVVDEVVEGRRDRRTTWRSSASPIADELRRRLRSAHRGEVRPGWTMGEDELLGAR